MTKNQPSTRTSTEFIDWLAVLQGFSMLLVVLGHVTLTNTFRDPATPLPSAIERIIYSFHMPLFIFTSGWLFFYTCIRRDRSYRQTISKKLIRLGVPFLFFTIVTIIIKLIFSSFVNRPVDSKEIVDTFLLFRSNPLGEMWFITVLFELMLLYPLYKVCARHSTLPWLLSASLVLIFVIPPDIDIFRLGLFFQMLPYFCAGLICCQYNLIQRFASHKSALLITTVIFLIINVFDIPPYFQPSTTSFDPLRSFCGIAFSVCFCMPLTSFAPRSFSSFREYTFQIFLLGIFFQMALRYIYARAPEWTYALLYSLSVLSGIYLPVFISGFIKRRLPSLRILFGL